MHVIDPGHRYLLRSLDAKSLEQEGIELRFVKRMGPGYPGNTSAYSGTTSQEVLRALIDRSKYVNNQVPDPHNALVLIYLREAILDLELRAAERHGRALPLLDITNIEDVETCRKCNHIGCPGTCH